MVKRLLDIHFFDGICIRCALGKHPHEKFDKGHAWKAFFPLELINSDIMCPFPNNSINQAKYVSFIDDCMIFTWV